MPNTRSSYLNYSFDVHLKDKYQTIFVGHFFGTTLAIQANFKPTFDSNRNVTHLSADFFSQHMGGFIYFALRDVNRLISTQASPKEEKVHLMGVKLNAFTDADADFDPLTLKFEVPFNVKTDILRIQIDNNDITNLTEGMIHGVEELINDDRSCNTIFGGENG